ncbi:glycosyltransferase family 32 protein [Roseateles albus]|uniref:Glycosyltransferase n=1 Tax=Roseateles albus TaxID=2987525 RepID=A0ABT5KH70_9BURK|nr:glycosyltransferase [Roseateles albus]MDC8772742.1 glycosyltransferase [Roseateles albus]
MSHKNPKILHRIYFDNFAPFHDPFEHYLESWSREMPDYKIMKWNMSNLNVHENAWTSTAFSANAPVFLSEYFRWKVLSEYGGVYLDADCEILNGKILHNLIEDLYSSTEYDDFFGVEEKTNGHPTAQTVGAKKGSELVLFMKALYEQNLPELWEWRERRGLIGPQLMSLFFLNKGINIKDDGFFKNIEEPTVSFRSKVYPQTYFSPKFTLLGESLDYQTAKTCVYHMFANSNVDFSGKRQLHKAREKAQTFDEYRAAIETSLKFPRRFDASWLSTNAGRQTEDGIQVEGVNGVVVHGPYATLPADQYVAKLHFTSSATSGMAEMRVTSDLGKNVLAIKRTLLPLTGEQTIVSPMFNTDVSTDNIEVVLSINGVSNITVKDVEFDIWKHQNSGASPAGSLKILHRIYFGFDGKPDQFKRYLETWAEHLPDYKIMHWDASNLPMDINPYVRKLYEEKDHAFLTDYFRWFVLREYGGTYLDADVELVNGEIFNQLIEELESSTDHEAFIGIDEMNGGWYTAHSMASKPMSDLSQFMCNVYENFGSFVAWRKKGFYFWAPQLVGLFFTNRGHHKDGMGTTPRLTTPTVVAGVKIYPQDWFSPLAPSAVTTEPFTLNAHTKNTCLCHHFACSWHDAGSKYLEYSQKSGGQANVLLADIAARVDTKRKFSATELSTSVGKRFDGGIVTNSTSGYLTYGPYINMSAGNHLVEFSLRNIMNIGDATLDIVSNMGETILLEKTKISSLEDGVFSRSVSLKGPENAVEFRIHIDELSDFSIYELNIQKI